MANEASGAQLCPTIPRFFRIIRTQTLRTNKLRISKRIVRKCGPTLTNEVLLKLPCNKEWKVGLTKSSDGKVWIQNGWLEFSRYYSLARGHLLVFMHECDSQFQVSIFNNTTTEIDYLDPHKQAKENENQDTFPKPFPRTRSKSAFPCSRPSKRSETSPRGKLNLSERRGGGSEKGCRLSPIEKAEARKRVVGFESDHPYFIHPMQPSYVRRHFVMNLPSNFARSHLGRVKKDVILKAVDGRTWSVRYTGLGLKAKFESGWKAFSLANDLKRGDVCVFAMTKRTRLILFEVSVFRGNEIINSDSVPEKNGSGSKLGPRRSLASEGKSTNTTTNEKTKLPTTRRFFKQLAGDGGARPPSFTVCMKASYASGRCNFFIPANFAKTYITRKSGKAILQVSDCRSWPVMYKKRRADGYSRTEFYDGWRVFVLENGLDAGDTCTFKLTHRDNNDGIVFEVSMDKVAQEATCNRTGAKSKARKFEEMTGGEVARIFKASKVPNK